MVSCNLSSVLLQQATQCIAIDAKAAENAIRSMFMVLIDGLPTDSLMPALIEKRVVTTTNKEKMDSMSSQIEKTVHLLNKIVIPSLKAKVLLAFEGFLEAVKESEELVCKSLAKDLSAKAGKVKVPLPKMIPPSGNDYCTPDLLHVILL